MKKQYIAITCLLMLCCACGGRTNQTITFYDTMQENKLADTKGEGLTKTLLEDKTLKVSDDKYSYTVKVQEENNQNKLTIDFPGQKKDYTYQAARKQLLKMDAVDMDGDKQKELFFLFSEKDKNGENESYEFLALYNTGNRLETLNLAGDKAIGAYDGKVSFTGDKRLVIEVPTVNHSWDFSIEDSYLCDTLYGKKEKYKTGQGGTRTVSDFSIIEKEGKKKLQLVQPIYGVNYKDIEGYLYAIQGYEKNQWNLEEMWVCGQVQPYMPEGYDKESLERQIVKTILDKHTDHCVNNSINKEFYSQEHDFNIPMYIASRSERKLYINYNDYRRVWEDEKDTEPKEEDYIMYTYDEEGNLQPLTYIVKKDDIQYELTEIGSASGILPKREELIFEDFDKKQQILEKIQKVMEEEIEKSSNRVEKILEIQVMDFDEEILRNSEIPFLKVYENNKYIGSMQIKNYESGDISIELKDLSYWYQDAEWEEYISNHSCLVVRE